MNLLLGISKLTVPKSLQRHVKNTEKLYTSLGFLDKVRDQSKA